MFRDVSFRSPPAQKAGPLPVRITAPIASALSAIRSAAFSSFINALFMALRCSGRFSVRTITSPEYSTRTLGSACVMLRSLGRNEAAHGFALQQALDRFRRPAEFAQHFFGVLAEAR